MKPAIRMAALGLSIVLASAFTFAGVASAETSASSPATDCRTVTSHLVKRPDNGHGAPPVWALDTMDRTIKVCHVTPVVVPEVATQTKVEVDVWEYNATLVDNGTFETVAGATGSPNNGAALKAQTGVMSGNATFKNFTAPHDWGYWNGDAMKKEFVGSAPSSTGNWIGNFWTDGFKGTSITSYKWGYWTCGGVQSGGEQWIDSSEPANDDGQSDTAGDITGKPCPAQASPTATPVVPAPVGLPSLPVTGLPAVGWIAIGGTVIAFFGAALWLSGRRRRTKFIA